MPLRLCDCEETAIRYQVRKEGPNKGRYFFTCDSRACKYFEWEDGINYNPARFRKGTCGRCGRYNHCAEECDEMDDFFGNEIPE